MEIDLNKLPNNLHLKGDFSENGVSALTPVCHNKMFNENIQLGMLEKKLSKNNLSFYQNTKVNKNFFVSIMKVLSELSLKKDVSIDKKREVIMIILANFIERNYSNIGDNDFALFCMPIGFNVDMETYLCECMQNGAITFIALKDFRGVSDEF